MLSLSSARAGGELLFYSPAVQGGVLMQEVSWMEDSPWSQLDDSAYRYRVDESFNDFMMYHPPDIGYGSQWVPLHLYTWKWQADVSRFGTWALGWTPHPPGYTFNLSSARCTTHPQWSNKLTNGN